MTHFFLGIVIGFFVNEFIFPLFALLNEWFTNYVAYRINIMNVKLEDFQSGVKPDKMGFSLKNNDS